MPLLGKFQDVANGEADGQKGAKTSHRPGKVGGFRRGEAEREHTCKIGWEVNGDAFSSCMDMLLWRPQLFPVIFSSHRDIRV